MLINEFLNFSRKDIMDEVGVTRGRLEAEE